MKITINEQDLKLLQNNWDKAKARFNCVSSEDWTPATSTELGDLSWTKPKEVLWLYANIKEESYEGQTVQIGITQDGTVVWGYFSHCSCYGYEDYSGTYWEFKGGEDTFKMYEMNGVEPDVLKVLENNLQMVLESLK